MQPVYNFQRKRPPDETELMIMRAIAFLSVKRTVNYSNIGSYLEEHGFPMSRKTLMDLLDELKRSALISGENSNSTIRLTIQGKILHDAMRD